jgi:hypothetical protein
MADFAESVTGGTGVLMNKSALVTKLTEFKGSCVCDTCTTDRDEVSDISKLDPARGKRRFNRCIEQAADVIVSRWGRVAEGYNDLGNEEGDASTSLEDPIPSSWGAGRGGSAIE